ncbi:hypothetical protein CKM354_000417200 [Cercospora kikuchii]|uniref:Uncharacterized protein n=1 Tax=Cercospora kikuchii TaxID=84275 RepID=A0A9P3CDC4_9PEZI|nr:uncharacterized protein CKM354_000417200 [Cercospora kikuchii]GIZ40849.1 hypothetical protein CKM354_000417200 [Cercospora kikuchii]
MSMTDTNATLQHNSQAAILHRGNFGEMNRVHDLDESGTATSEHMTEQEDDSCPHSAEADPQDGQQTGSVPDADAQQAIRDQHYVSFFEENSPEDYTDGPARFVLATDGIKDGVALLLTFDLGLKINRATELHRIYSREKRHADAQSDKIRDFVSTINSEILSHRTRIAIAKSLDVSQDQDSTSATVRSLELELHVLEGMLQDMDFRQQSLEGQLRFRGEMLREAQEDVANYLDEAFVAGNLVAPDSEEEIPVEEFELQSEYQKAFQEEFGGEALVEDEIEIASPPVLDTSREHLQANVVPPAPEEQAEIKVRLALENAVERWVAAEQAFDYKELARAQDFYITRAKWDQGEKTQDADPEAFDLRWYQNFQATTRELVEAEEELHQARVAACEAGLEHDGMQEDCFADCASDGFCDSEVGHDTNFWGHFAATCKNDKKTNGWLDTLPEDMLDPEEPGPVPEIDEWGAKEVETWESQSTVATRAIERRRIDERQQEVTWHDRIRKLFDGLAA